MLPEHELQSIAARLCTHEIDLSLTCPCLVEISLRGLVLCTEKAWIGRRQSCKPECHYMNGP